MSMKKLTMDDFVRRAKKLHKDKYDYFKYSYEGSKTKGEIICPKHGSFFQTPNDHLTKGGCGKCGRERGGLTRRLSSEKFIEKSILRHGKFYDYSKSNYKCALQKITIICPFHGDFFQSPYNHLLGKGCPKCNISKGERKIINILDEEKIEYETQKLSPTVSILKPNINSVSISTFHHKIY